MEEKHEKIGRTKYKVSSFGEIINGDTGVPLKTIRDAKGYLKVALLIDGKYHQFYVHRLVAEAFLEKPKDVDEKMLCVKHKDFNKENNYVGNLEWGTFSSIIKEAHKREIYKDHLDNLKKKILMIDKLNCREIEFKSLLEAAMYLKTAKEGLPDVFSIRANISVALYSKSHMAYDYYWEER